MRASNSIFRDGHVTQSILDWQYLRKHERSPNCIQQSQYRLQVTGKTRPPIKMIDCWPAHKKAIIQARREPHYWKSEIKGGEDQKKRKHI
eukprot:1158165-Pelagomonas_calceolata.AAC.15